MLYCFEHFDLEFEGQFALFESAELTGASWFEGTPVEPVSDAPMLHIEMGSTVSDQTIWEILQLFGLARHT